MHDSSFISTAGAITLKISHGYTVSETGADSFVTLAEKTLEEFSLATTPGAFLVDFLPWRTSNFRFLGKLKWCQLTLPLQSNMSQPGSQVPASNEPQENGATI